MLNIVDLESVESRYTYYWKDHLPKLFSGAGLKVRQISGEESLPPPKTGQFLNFAATNIYKSQQTEKMSRLFVDEKINKYDQFLFTDAWHPGILQLKYMSKLTGIPIQIYALWHAGSYDRNDFLGRLAGGEDWISHTELALFNAIDVNFFATNYHRNLFLDYYTEANEKKIAITGWPMEYVRHLTTLYPVKEKENIIVFPHRLAPEKQIDVFRELEKCMPEYDFVVCQEKNLSKKEYYEILAKAKIVFSANLQETLGISTYEGYIFKAIPVVPDWLSYREMYPNNVKYPHSWISKTQKNIPEIASFIKNVIINYESICSSLQEHIQIHEFFNASRLTQRIINDKNFRSN